MGWNTPNGARLALLVDPHRDAAHPLRPLFDAHGIEVIHARAGIAALELLQRMPDRFAIAIVCLDLPDHSGTAIVETMRHFLPGLPVICLTGAGANQVGVAATLCLPRGTRKSDLRAQIDRALAGAGEPLSLAVISPDVIARAKASYAVNRNLLDASREIALGLPNSSNGGE